MLLREGADGSIWLGSRGNGLSIDGKWYTYHSDDPLSIGNNNILLFTGTGRIECG